MNNGEKMGNSNKRNFNNPMEDGERVNDGDDDELILSGYRFSFMRTLMAAILVLASGGLLLLLFAFKPELTVRLTKRRCSVEEAQVLLVKDRQGDVFVEPVYYIEIKPRFWFRYFMHQKLKYFWNEEYKYFFKYTGMESERCSVLYNQMSGGFCGGEAQLSLSMNGPNLIEVNVKPIWKLILKEVIAPFYMYQAFIVAVWLLQWYYQFAACILLLSTITVATHVWQTRKQIISLRKKVHSWSMVRVLRDSVPQDISSIGLVPGDVIFLPKRKQGQPKLVMECDAVLMVGVCTMDESMLTGESLPVPKVPLAESPTTAYSPVKHKSSTLFAGTKILNISVNPTAEANASHDDHDEDFIEEINDDDEDDEYKECAIAVVVRTGFNTTKGELARSILFPVQLNNNIRRQMIKLFIIFLFVIGIPSIVFTYFALSRFQFEMSHILIVVLDVATFLIPPMLPAILTSVNVHAQRRLKRKGIFCLNPQAICCAGEIDVMCFDKTGTLTEDAIDFSGLIPNIPGTEFGQEIQDSPADGAVIGNDDLVAAMAACHSLVEFDGQIQGDELEMSLFIASGWEMVPLETAMDNGFCNGFIPERIVSDMDRYLCIMKQFPFESALQRMLVLVIDSSQDCLMAMVKGAPEVIRTLCKPESIPVNYNDVLERYASNGYRVLATATKKMPKQDRMDFERKELECDLIFNGFILFKNKIRPTTHGILKELTVANIRNVMVTGDNILTAIHVAQECGMIKPADSIIQVRATTGSDPEEVAIQYKYVKEADFVMVEENNNEDLDVEERLHQGRYHFAIDGDSFKMIRKHNLQLLQKIVHRGTIFARMMPDQKRELISLLRWQGHCVGMCGDGANDCGALRAADAGISLSMADASVASSFTYKHKNITCVPMLIKEGRCTLVNVFGTLKYQISYCFVLLGAAMILFWHGFKPSEGTYVYVDIVMNILPPMVFGTTEPNSKLSKRMPCRNLLSFIPQASMYVFIAIQVAIYYMAGQMAMNQPWFQPVINRNIETPLPNQLSYTIFACNVMSYVIAAVVFAPGPPHRKGFFSNKIYLTMVVINLILATMLSPFGTKFLLDYLDFIPIPMEFRITLLGLSVANFLICLLFEKVILDCLVYRYLAPWLSARFKYFRCAEQKRFEVLEQQLSEENWPLCHLIH